MPHDPWALAAFVLSMYAVVVLFSKRSTMLPGLFFLSIWLAGAVAVVSVLVAFGAGPNAAQYLLLYVPTALLLRRFHKTRPFRIQIQHTQRLREAKHNGVAIERASRKFDEAVSVMGA